jgi:hypothetical protein
MPSATLSSERLVVARLAAQAAAPELLGAVVRWRVWYLFRLLPSRLRLPDRRRVLAELFQTVRPVRPIRRRRSVGNRKTVAETCRALRTVLGLGAADVRRGCGNWQEKP